MFVLRVLVNVEVGVLWKVRGMAYPNVDVPAHDRTLEQAVKGPHLKQVHYLDVGNKGKVLRSQVPPVARKKD
jgi:hypothetical protein